METEALARELATDLRPVRRLPAAEVRAAMWGAFAIASVAAGVAALGVRADLAAKLGDAAFVGDGAVLLIAFALAARSAFAHAVPGAATAPAGAVAALAAWACFVALRPSGAPIDDGW